jgi:hypothetical protein
VASSGRGIADPIEATVTLQPRSRATLAWALWLVTMAACVAGLVVALVVARPLTAQVVLDGALYALGFPLGYAAAGLALHGLSLLAALLCVILRFWSSRGVERQQMRWIATGAAIAVLGVTVPLGDLRGAWLDSLVVLCVPLAVAVAVLRYRLWDLDRIISRTVAYALLTLLLGLGYAAVVLGLGRLLPESSTLAVAAATLAAVAAFAPLRRRVQQVVDRRFNRRRYDAARTVEGFAARLRDQVDLDALHGELLGVVDQTMQPTRASLWLRPRQEAETGAR